jgi:hypothetical protein
VSCTSVDQKDKNEMAKFDNENNHQYARFVRQNKREEDAISYPTKDGIFFPLVL